MSITRLLPPLSTRIASDRRMARSMAMVIGLVSLSAWAQAQPALDPEDEESAPAPGPTSPRAERPAADAEKAGPPSPSPPAAAEPETEETTAPPALDVMVVGERLDTRSRSPYPLSGTSREEFVNQPKSQHLADIIERMPGVFGQGDLGANMDTGLRGLNHHWTRFEFDGIMLPGIGVHRDFRINRLSPIAVEEIISLRNPPPEYESDGIGGHLVAIRRPIPRSRYLEVEAGVSMAVGDEIGPGFGGDAAVAVGTPLGRNYGMTTFVSYDRYPLFKRRTTLITNNDDGGTREEQLLTSETFYETANLFSDLAYQYRHGELHLKPMFVSFRQTADSTTERRYPDDDPRDIESEVVRPRYLAAITLSNLVRLHEGAALETDLTYARSWQTQYSVDETFLEQAAGTTWDGTVTRSRGTLHHFPQIRVKYTKAFDLGGVPQVFKMGVMGRWREYHTADHRTDLDADGSPPEVTTPEGEFAVWENYYAFFVQDQFTFSDLTILPGVRVEYSDNSVEVYQDNQNNQSLRAQTRQDSDTFDVNPSVSVLYRLGDVWSIRGSVSRTINRPGFREQSTLELDRDVIERGDPDLVAPRSWNLDVGIDAKPHRQVFLAAAGYYKRMSDVVEMVDTGQTRVVDGEPKPIYQYSNIGDGVIYGVEFEQRFGVGLLADALSGLTLRANETILHTRATLADGTEQPFNAHANVLANLGADWHVASWGTDFSANVKFQGKYKNYRTAEDVETTEPTWYLTAGIGQQFCEWLRLWIEGHNLLFETQDRVRVRSDRTQTATTEYGTLLRTSLRGEF